MIKKKNLAPDVNALLLGMMVGNIYFVNGTAGDDSATGLSFKEGNRSVAAAVKKCVTNNHDYVICFGSLTQTVAISTALNYLHLIAGGPMLASAGRGFAFTGMATTANITSTGTFFELAGFQHIGPATDAVSVSTTGANAFIHHNSFHGSTTASDAKRISSTGSYATIANNKFHLCKLPIDVAGVESVIEYNYMDDVDTGAIGVNLSVNTADRCIVRGNTFNFSGGTGDVGLNIVSGANQCLVERNFFNAALSNPIADAGTGTMFVYNFSTSIAGATGASLPLAIIT